MKYRVKFTPKRNLLGSYNSCTIDEYTGSMIPYNAVENIFFYKENPSYYEIFVDQPTMIDAFNEGYRLIMEYLEEK